MDKSLETYLDEIIEATIPPKDLEFQNIVREAFKPLFSFIIDHPSPNGKIDSLTPVLTLIQKLCSEIDEKTANFSETHSIYLTAVINSFISDLSYDNSVPEDMKLSLIDQQLANLEKFRFRYPDSSKNPSGQYEEYLKDQQVSLHKSGLVSMSFDDYSRKRNSRILERISKEFLFNPIILEKLDPLLRGIWFDENNPNLLLLASKNVEPSKPHFNWKKSRYALIHLFYLLNGRKRNETIVGNLSLVLSNLFYIGGKKFTQIEISRSSSKLLNLNISDYPEISEIERIFTLCDNEFSKDFFGD